jgi:20S proteasome alpha/beta subunit
MNSLSRLTKISHFLLLASQSVKKIIEINPYLLGTMAGGAAGVCNLMKAIN